MKIFNRDWRVNFVDDNNVLVGFDDSQCCCEDFGWSLTREMPKACNEGANGIDPEGFQFDPSFHKEATDIEYYEGGTAVFRLTKGDEEIFLLLWNFHNGYYAHGFEMKRGDEVIHSDSL